MTAAEFDAKVTAAIRRQVARGESEVSAVADVLCSDFDAPAPNADEVKAAKEHDKKAMSPFGEMLFEQAKTLTTVSQEAFRQGLEEGKRQAAKRIERLEATLEECLEYFEDRYDVVDGAYGQPAANREMQLGQMIEFALGRRP